MNDIETWARRYCIEVLHLDPDEVVTIPSTSMAVMKGARWRIYAPRFRELQAMLHIMGVII